jgi:hypothetical protein
MRPQLSNARRSTRDTVKDGNSRTTTQNEQQKYSGSPSVRHAWIALVLLLGVATVQAAGAPIVIVLSWDGVRHDFPDRTTLPGLERIETEGVRARRLISVWPANTFPGHVSMATGTYPDRHGIVDNRFFDRTRGVYSYGSDANWMMTEPLWIAAERQGLRAATYFWVGSESDWHGQRSSYRIAPFASGRAESLKVEQILAWLGLSDAERPQLIMSYWAGVDSVGHRHGPANRRLERQIVAQDAQLQRLQKGIEELGLWPVTTLIVVSDHGMTATERGLDLAGVLQHAGIRARVFGSSLAHVFVEDSQEIAAAGEVLEQFAARNCPGAKVFRGGRLPAGMRLGHPGRTGDWVLVGVPPCTFSTGTDPGGHGYDPRHADMSGIFYAMGSGVPAGIELGEVRQIDLAATVAGILGIAPPLGSEGKSIW